MYGTVLNLRVASFRPVLTWGVAPNQGNFTFHTFGSEQFLDCRVMYSGKWGNTVIGRNYLVRQAATLLKFAKSTTDPQVVAALVEKADQLRSQVDESSPAPDQSPRAPDVAPER